MKTLNVIFNHFKKSTKYEDLKLVYFLKEVTNKSTGLKTMEFSSYFAVATIKFDGFNKGDLIEITLEETSMIKSAKGNNYLIITNIKIIKKVSTNKEEASEASQELKETLGLR